MKLQMFSDTPAHLPPQKRENPTPLRMAGLTIDNTHTHYLGTDSCLPCEAKILGLEQGLPKLGVRNVEMTAALPLSAEQLLRRFTAIFSGRRRD
jgi:hypothetical protein